MYFSVRSFPGYGKLSGRDIDELESGARVDVDERKRDPLDFALWKSAKPGEPHWPSPWGEGRPGWHLECSVMSEMELGTPFDIHGGATDLIFPHHENETGTVGSGHRTRFVRYWMHGGLLQINAEKMSKSLGNFLLLKDILESYPAPTVRLLMLQTHYRSPLDFSTDRLDEAGTALGRLQTLVATVDWLSGRPAPGPGAPARERLGLASAVAAARERFTSEMDDDFNTAGALAGLFDLVRSANSFVASHEGDLSADDVDALGGARDTVVELLGVLGVRIPRAGSATGGGEGIDQLAELDLPEGVLSLASRVVGYEGGDRPGAVRALLEARDRARAAKDWARADAVRDGLAALGVTVEDTASGARVAVRRG